MKHPQKTLLIVAMTAAALFCWVGAFLVDVGRTEWGENVSPESWLPRAASRVSFYKSYNQTLYEFDISEPEFVRWSSWRLSPVTKPVRVMRWLDLVPGQLDRADGIGTADRHESGSAVINDGLFYISTESNGGGIWVAYDREASRAYFHSARR